MYGDQPNTSLCVIMNVFMTVVINEHIDAKCTDKATLE
jgi:hypothetical protein